MRSVETGGMLQPLFHFLCAFTFFFFFLASPRCRCRQCKWSTDKIKIEKATKDFCVLWTLRNAAELNTTLVIVSVITTLQLILLLHWHLLTHTYILLRNQPTHTQLCVLACLACPHLWPIKIYHSQGSDTYQMPAGRGNRVCLYHTHYIGRIHYNCQPLNLICLNTLLISLL